MSKKIIMTEAKRRICELDTEIIAYDIRHPFIACDVFLGLSPIDS